MPEPQQQPDAAPADPSPEGAASAPSSTSTSTEQAASDAASAAGSPEKAAAESVAATSFANLPSYARSLLNINVQVTATLAKSKRPLSEVLDLAPGSILQFNKTCEEMLELEVAGRAIAEGEAVKVGEKFGLRITSIKLPDERFKPLRRG